MEPSYPVIPINHRGVLGKVQYGTYSYPVIPINHRGVLGTVQYGT